MRKIVGTLGSKGVYLFVASVLDEVVEEVLREKNNGIGKVKGEHMRMHALENLVLYKLDT